MSAAFANSHRISRIWAPPSTPPRRFRPRGMRSPMLMPLSTRCWRGHGGHPVDPLRAEAVAGRSGAAQGDHGDLVRCLIAPQQSSFFLQSRYTPLPLWRDLAER
jgi:hypothetical protein